jgi:hypothetical protein
LQRIDSLTFTLNLSPNSTNSFRHSEMLYA